MIIVKLMGGLGNQMFQYAAGRRLAHVHRTELKLDHSFLESREDVATLRQYGLCHFQVQCGRATTEDCSAVALHGVWGGKRFFLSILPRTMQLSRSPRYISERSFRFDPVVLEAEDDVYLSGYWQTERYFADIADILRKEFTVRPPLSGENLQVAREIGNCCSVSLHIRRGDYVTNQRTASFHGVCGLEYYARGIKRLAELKKNIHLFIFSDDIPWVKTHLPIPYPGTYVEHNPPEMGHEDLRLMSLCKHHIIANSTFSWWGAWLNPRPDKIVIAPQNWFNDPSVDVSDLIPTAWIRI